MPVLLFLTGPRAGLRHPVDGEVTLGRSPSCQVTLDDRKVSRKHARLAVRGDGAWLGDLGSRNGTVVNGQVIREEVLLGPGDRIQIGETTVLFDPPFSASLTDGVPGELRSTPAEEVLPRAGSVAAAYELGAALMEASSDAMVLRLAAEHVVRGMNAECAAAMLGGALGPLTAAVVGADGVEVPRVMATAALERGEVSRASGCLVAPICASGGGAFGLLMAVRPEAFLALDEGTMAALGRLAGEALASRLANSSEEGPVVLVGASRQFKRSLDQARRLAAGDGNAYLFGEAGVGKSLTAKFVHQRSRRTSGAWVVVDCRRAPEEAEADLFGTPSGPATAPRSSALLRADGGTLLLTHVQFLSRRTADRLADFVTRKVAPRRHGGEGPVDVRVLATGRSSAHAGLPHRGLSPGLVEVLGGREVQVLSLSARRSDVGLLFDHFAQEFGRARRAEPVTLSPDAKKALVDYDWPCNISELRGVAERLTALYPGEEIPASKLPPEVLAGAVGRISTLGERVSRLEQDAVIEALRLARGKKVRAAALLGISRPTLDKKISDYALVVRKRSRR